MKPLIPRDYQETAFKKTGSGLTSRPEKRPLIVMPTGSGKSLVLAELIKWAVSLEAQCVVTTHRQELIEQDAKAIVRQGVGDVGCYSAGLGMKNTTAQVVVAGIQSIWRNAGALGNRQLVFIDESHLIPEDGEGMYRTFLADIQANNERVCIGGLTASPYRTKTGLQYGSERGKLFDYVSHKVEILPLIKDGWLSELVTQPTCQINNDELNIRQGEYVAREVAEAFTDEINELACAELVAATIDRNCTLVFCATIEHMERVHDTLLKMTSRPIRMLSGKTKDRKKILDDFKMGLIPYLLNVNVLTTGFDAPNIDAIGVMRSINSPGLLYQMLGRGFRIFTGKENCLILDFGGNLRQHGPIDSPSYGVNTQRSRKGQNKESGESSSKVCTECDATIPSTQRFCGFCGANQPKKRIHDAESDGDSKVLGGGEKEYREWKVADIEFSRHVKVNKDEHKPDTMRLDVQVYNPNQCINEGEVMPHVCGECEGQTISAYNREDENWYAYCMKCDKLLEQIKRAGNLSIETISFWFGVEHVGNYHAKFVSFWWKVSKAKTPSVIEHAIWYQLHGYVAEIQSIKTSKRGRFYELESVRCGVIPDPPDPPVFQDEPTETIEDEFDESPF